MLRRCPPGLNVRLLLDLAALSATRRNTCAPLGRLSVIDFANRGRDGPATTQDSAALYRVSYMLTWFETHDDADASNDTVVGQAVIRPSETSENVCGTTPFANATTVVYEVPCTVTAQGIVI